MAGLKSCTDACRYRERRRGTIGRRQKRVLRSAYPISLSLDGAPIHPSDEDLSLGTPESCSAQDDKSREDGLDWYD